MESDPVVTGAALALWLRLETAERVAAMSDLISSGDLLVRNDGDHFGLIRGHGDAVSRFEIGNALPMLPPATA